VPTIVLMTILARESAHGASGDGCCLDADQLRKFSECQLDQLFTQADSGPIPVGHARGRVLVMANTKLPRMKRCMINAVWKGKAFGDDGYFINQWVCFQALDSKAGHGVSWYDGKPCIVMEYAPGTPVFANSRDELRQIGPNLYLGRLYDRCPCPKFRAYLLLEMQTCGSCNPH
jgi:hypothetical protein